MYKKVAKKLLLGLLAVAMLLTTVVVMPTDAQAAGKKVKKATISDEYKIFALDGQKGYVKTHPWKLPVSYVVNNRNKNAKYTFFSSNKNVLKITKDGKLTEVNATKDQQNVNIIVKETLNKKTRKIGTIKCIIVLPRVISDNIQWYAGQTYNMFFEDWFDNKYAKKEISYLPFWCWNKCTFRGTDQEVTQETIDKWLTELNSTTPNDKQDDQSKYYTWAPKSGEVETKEEGKINCAFFAYDYGTKTYYYVDKFTINITKVTKAKKIEFEESDWLEGYDGPVCFVGEKDSYYCEVTPNEYAGEMKVTSSDETVATATWNQKEKCIEVKGIKKGNVTITIEANGAKASMKLKVISSGH